MRIIIDPRSNYSYSSFYLYGLKQLYGRSSISFDLKPFLQLGEPRNNLRMKIIADTDTINVFIQTDDFNRVSSTDYDWCDIYGSVNANFKLCPQESYPKLLSLAPSFGIRNELTLAQALWGGIIQFLQTWRYVIHRTEWNKTLEKEECDIYTNIKHFFYRRYKSWKHRLPLSAYSNDIQSENNYIYFLSTLWYSDKYNRNDENVNLSRALFIRACQSIDTLSFEGGLVAERDSFNTTFQDVVIHQRTPFPVWLEKTKRSSLVFNTPAFWGCHGWKLGEYLALGKCIISTPLINDLPHPLEHGINVHFVENTEQSMSEAIRFIISHPDYRHNLEWGARCYWEKYGAPLKSLELLGIS